MTARALTFEVIDLASGNCMAAFEFLNEAKSDLREYLDEGEVQPRDVCLVAFDADGEPVWTRVADPSWLAA
jgi:hypothetical protein